MNELTRRRALTALGTAATAGTVATAGCLGLGGSNDGETVDFSDLELGDQEASEEVDIDIWLSIGAPDLLQGIADDFVEQSETIDITVSEEGSYDEVWTQLQQARQAGNQPAIAHLNAIATLPAWTLDVITPIGEVFGEAFNFDDFVDAVGNYYIIDELLMALPLGVSTVTTSYNRTAFENAGLPSHPDDVSLETFADWNRVSEALVEDAGLPQAATWPGVSWLYETFFALNGQELLNNRNGRQAPATESYLDSEAASEIYQWTAELYRNDHYLYSDGYGSARQAFLNKEAAIELNTSAGLATVGQNARDSGFEHGVGTLPSASASDRGGPIIGGGALFIPRGISKAEAEAAAEFLLWFSEPEQQARWHMNTGYHPTSDQAEQIAEQQGFYETAPQFKRALQQFKQRPETPATAGALTFDHREIRTEVANSVERLLGGASPDSVLSSATEAVDSVLERASDADPRS